MMLEDDVCSKGEVFVHAYDRIVEWGLGGGGVSELMREGNATKRRVMNGRTSGV